MFFPELVNRIFQNRLHLDIILNLILICFLHFLEALKGGQVFSVFIRVEADTGSRIRSIIQRHLQRFRTVQPCSAGSASQKPCRSRFHTSNDTVIISIVQLIPPIQKRRDICLIIKDRRKPCSKPHHFCCLHFEFKRCVFMETHGQRRLRYSCMVDGI